MTQPIDSNKQYPLRRWLVTIGGALAGLLAVGTVLVSSFSDPQTVWRWTLTDMHLTLGNPSAAIPSTLTPDNYLIVRPQYALSYNRSRGSANWASWQLSRDWLGDQPRRSFMPDPALPSDWYAVTPNDYTGSGFDRGHLVPAADRDRTEADSEAVFVMTNILPQAPDNNQGPWEKLERYCRTLAEQGNTLYIVAGGTGEGGVGSKGPARSLHNKVMVPASLWKVVAVLPSAAADGTTVTAKTRLIAVLMPNQQGIKEEDWRQFRTSVDAIETLTGYNFFAAVPEDIQGMLESRVDGE